MNASKTGSSNLHDRYTEVNGVRLHYVEGGEGPLLLFLHGFPSSGMAGKTVPTLVIWGEKDIALMAGNLDGLEQYVKDLRIHRLAQAGHFVVHEQPADVIQSMRRFLQEG